MTKKIRLSVVLATRNEESNIGRCLESIKSIADEIIVVDEQSTDRTVTIAKKYHARTIPSPHNPNFHITKNIAIDAAVGEWILQLDADEVVSPELAREIVRVTRDSSSTAQAINGYWVNRKNWFLTRFLTKGGQYPDPSLRLYRRGAGRLPAIDVHEQAQVEGRVGHLQHDLLHYRDTDFQKYLAGFHRYSLFKACQLADRNQKVSPLTALDYLFFRPPFTFLKVYIRHKGFVDGLPGFIFALFSGLIYPAAFLKYLRLKPPSP